MKSEAFWRDVSLRSTWQTVHRKVKCSLCYAEVRSICSKMKNSWNLICLPSIYFLQLLTFCLQHCGGWRCAKSTAAGGKPQHLLLFSEFVKSFIFAKSEQRYWQTENSVTTLLQVTGTTEKEGDERNKRCKRRKTLHRTGRDNTVKSTFFQHVHPCNRIRRYKSL